MSQQQQQKQQQQHFLVVAIGAQGHINPARQLARRLAGTIGARVSIAIPIQTLRRMIANNKEETFYEQEPLISYTPYSDGIEGDGLNPVANPHHLPDFNRRIAQSLTRIADDFCNQGRPLTCIIHALFLSVAADVARALGIPSVLFWIQPAAAFAIYYHFFNYSTYLLEIPGQPPLQAEDLPSFITAPPKSDHGLSFFTFTLLQQVFLSIKKDVSAGVKAKVLVNTFDDLEPQSVVLSGMDGVEMISVGPLLPPSVTATATATAAAAADLFEQDEVPYMEWLDRKQEGSVVYVSFGSICMLSEKQMEEIMKGLEGSGRPYLWALRRDSRGEWFDERRSRWRREVGMVVEWCRQVRVLSHRAVGCFVTHCGWNSVLESVLCGVPLVMLPQWSDQAMNARLAEGWGIGVRAAASADEGVVDGGELERCLDLVMGEEEEEEGGMRRRRRAEMWREKARRAAEEGGSSDRNLRALFSKGI